MTALYSIIIIIAFTFCGYLFSEKYKNRVLLYRTLVYLCDEFRDNLLTSKLTVKEFLTKNLSDDDSLNKYILDTISGCKTSYNGVSEEDRDSIKALVSGLGKNDVSSQLMYIEYQRIKMNALYEQAENNYQKKAKSLQKASILVGFMFGILVI